MTTITESQLESLRKYLDEDCQSHLKAHGKWRLDSGKLVAALGKAGIAVERGDLDRDRATKPRIGDQTMCKFCYLDIEYQGKQFGWIDRGGNRRCQEEDVREPRRHQPVSDRS